MDRVRVALIGNQAFALLNFRDVLIDDFVGRGAEVFALAPDFDDSSRAKTKELGATPVDISLSRSGLNPLRDAWDTLLLWRKLSRLNLDLVLGMTIKPVLYGTIAAKLARVPSRYAMFTGLGSAFGEATSRQHRTKSVFVGAVCRFVLSHAHGVFTQNPDDADELVSMGIVQREKVTTVNGTGVDLTAWQRKPVQANPITFTMAARLISAKGVREFVGAARIVRHKYPNTRFVLLGGLDSNASRIEREEVDAWVVEGIIEWPGHVAVRSWLEVASVFVLPSYYREGVPRGIQEAMAIGRPIVTTNTPGCKETVVDGHNGYLVPARDVASLSQALMRFVEKPELLAEMGENSRKMAEKRFDARAINAKMLDTMGL